MSPGRYRTAADADPENLEPSQPRRSKPRRPPSAGDPPLPAHRNIGLPHRSRLGSYATLQLATCNFCNFVILGSSAGSAHAQPRAHVPYLVGTRLPSPYHFRARIQSFQAVAAPFPGDSVFPSATTPRFKDRRSARRSPLKSRHENKYRTTTQLWQEIYRAVWELATFRAVARDSSRTAETLPLAGERSIAQR